MNVVGFESLVNVVEIEYLVTNMLDYMLVLNMLALFLAVPQEQQLEQTVALFEKKCTDLPSIQGGPGRYCWDD